MTAILAIETATEACSAALLISSDNSSTPDKTFVRFEHAPREHTKLILPMLDHILSEGNHQLSEVDAIAFGRGPGAFTGLRIAAGIAQGVALSVNKPVIAISTLAALAQQAILSDDYQSEEDIIVALDARMGEVYWGKFRSNNGEVVLIGEEQVSKPEVLLDVIKKEPAILIGNGWDVYSRELLTDNENDFNVTIIKNQFPSAEFIAQLAIPFFLKNDVQRPEDAQPVYIRNNVAKKSLKV